MSLLKNFLEPSEDGSLTIKEAIKNIDENCIDLKKFNLAQRTVSDNNEVQCYGPKILICQEYDTITIYRFNRRLSRSCNSRIITIVDDDNNSKFKKVMTTKLKKDNRKYKSTPMDYTIRNLQNESIITYEEEFNLTYNENNFNNFYDDSQYYW